MKTFIFLLLAISLVGACPRMVWAQDNSNQKAVVHQHYKDMVSLRDRVRQLKMDIAELQGKLGATILLGEDRDEYNRLMADDIDHLAATRASLRSAVQYLLQHMPDLSQGEKGDVEEALIHPE